MKKSEMVAFIKSNRKKVSKNLRDMVNYTVKMYEDSPKSVTVQDLRSLVKDIQTELAIVAPQATSASVKKEATPKKKDAAKKTVEKSEKTSKKGKKSSKKADDEEKPKKKETPKKESKKSEAPVEEEEKPKKKGGKKAKKKFESGVEPQNTVGEAFNLAEAFKDEIETPLGIIKKDDSIKNIKDVAKILEAGEKEVMCAVYWTERHLAQFPYTSIEGIAQPESFDNDLDLVSIIFVAPDNSLMIGVSSYTFVPYVFSKVSMKQTKGIRYNAGAEFNVYTLDAEGDAE